ncbi:MAG: peptidylprolyl isomerase [Planctomycetota bacterium]
MPSTLESMQSQIEALAIDQSKDRWRTTLPSPESLEISKDDSYFWNLETNKGPIKIRLMPDVAPQHTLSTIYLTMLGFYDGLSFHRIIPGFMAQGGCPLGTGTGGPGYQYAGEFDRSVRHDRRGLLSMANAGPDTDGSQFFITFVPTPHLDGNHTIFGEVVGGMETLGELEGAGSPSGKPTEKLVIEKATITES